MAQDVSLLRRVKQKDTKRIGDIAGMRVKDDKGNIWWIFIEGKNRTDQGELKEGLEVLQTCETKLTNLFIASHQIEHVWFFQKRKTWI